MGKNKKWESEGKEKFIKSVGEDYQVVKRGSEYHDCGEEHNV